MIVSDKWVVFGISCFACFVFYWAFSYSGAIGSSLDEVLRFSACFFIIVFPSIVFSFKKEDSKI